MKRTAGLTWLAGAGALAAVALAAVLFLGHDAQVPGSGDEQPGGKAAAVGQRPPQSVPAGSPGAAAVPTDTEAEAEAEEAEGMIVSAMQSWTGDLDGMIERRAIRVLVPFSKTFYFVDRGHQRGITYEVLKQFEDDLNRRLHSKALKVHVVFIPTSRDRLLGGLVDGQGDIAAGNLTVTPERLEQVDFSDPFLSGVREIVITGPASPPIATLDDLAGKSVVVRRSSSYYESLTALNERFRREAKPEVILEPVDENLEDEDLIEMVNAGLYSIIVIDEHKARFWKQVFPGIAVHEDIVLRDNGEIAWAFRKNSPRLKAEINAFAKGHKIGTTFGNILLHRYFRDAKYVKNSVNDAELKKFRDAIALFQQYAGRYDFDWLMIAAQAYQESGIDQSVRSPVGAVGVMQVMPKTAAAAPILIPDIYTIDNNIHAGVKYLRYLIDQYFDDPQIAPVDRLLFAFASYNGGPNRIDRLRRKAAAQGLDPNRWFQNVEIVVARHIGRETTQYVGNIFKYYVAYRRVIEERDQREAARKRAIEEAGGR